ALTEFVRGLGRTAGVARAGRAERARGARSVAVGSRRAARADSRAEAGRKARLRGSREPQRRAVVSDAVQPDQGRAVRRARDVAACAGTAGAASTNRVFRY